MDISLISRLFPGAAVFARTIDRYGWLFGIDI